MPSCPQPPSPLAQVILQRMDKLSPRAQLFPTSLSSACPSPRAQVILQRMDRLSPRAQLCLKVASIMGQVVDADVLRRFHPLKMCK